MKIVIPTLGRVNNQLTYNALPDKWKAQTLFVVQEHEGDIMKKTYPNNEVLVLPSNIDNLPETRNWIMNEFRKRKELIWTPDDDLEGFSYRCPIKGAVNGVKWFNEKLGDYTFDEMFDRMHALQSLNIFHGAISTTWTMPSIDTWPEASTTRCMTNHFIDYSRIPEDVKYRTKAAEDLDFTLQLLTKGYDNRVLCQYVVNPGTTNSDGGCSTYRTLEVHNKDQEYLASLWPRYIKLKKKLVKSGSWKGKEKYASSIRWKKAYADGRNSVKSTYKKLFA